MNFSTENHVCSHKKVTAQLICAFVFTYSKIQFSHDMAHFTVAYNVHVQGPLVQSISSLTMSLRRNLVIIKYLATELSN